MARGLGIMFLLARMGVLDWVSFAVWVLDVGGLPGSVGAKHAGA